MRVVVLRYKRDELGRLVEVPPELLDCGHPYRRGLVVIGYEEHPQHPVRVRCYRCRHCGEVTWTEPA